MRLLSEISLAARSLARAPGLVAVAVVSLALGLGANVTIFSFVNAIEFRPLPFSHPERLLDLSEDNPAELCEGCAVGTSWPTYQLWRQSARSFTSLEAYREESYALSGEQEPERTGGALVSAGLFPLLGTRPVRGRSFIAADELPGATPVVLIGHGLWTRRFGGDSAVLGRQVRVNGIPRTIVGVMPPGFRFPEFAALWLPMAPEVQTMTVSERWLGVVGRLAPAVSLPAARLEMTAIAARLATERPRDYAGWTVRTGLLHDDLTKDQSAQGFLLALAAAGFVLLIACANLANLFLARATTRAREMAVRVALGASRARIALHLLLESVLLGLAGGVLGLALSLWGVRMITRLIGAELPFWLAPGADWRLVLFSFALSIAAGLAFGLLPAFRASRTDLNETLKTGSIGATAGRRDSRIRGALAVAQISLAIVLLAGAGLMVKSFMVVRRTDNLGYNPQGVLSAQVQLQSPRYARPDQMRAFQEQLLERLRVQPMVESSAIETTEFLGTFVGNGSRVTLEGAAEPIPNAESPRFGFGVTPEYFAVLQIPVRRGRGITPVDRVGTPAVAVLTAATAARLWPNQDPLGKRLRLGAAGSERLVTVVGIVGDIIGSPLGRGNAMFLYTAAAQAPARPFKLLIRYRGDQTTLATTLRAVARTVDADEPVEEVMTLEQSLAQWIRPVRFVGALLAALGGVALLLAAFGIYGVMSYLVSRRTRELGIRMALGAEGADLRRYVLGRGLRLALLGLGTGLPAAFLLAKLLRQVLFAVSPADPAVFVTVAVLLAGIAVLACWPPARRATQVNPLDALRSE